MSYLGFGVTVRVSLSTAITDLVATRAVLAVAELLVLFQALFQCTLYWAFLVTVASLRYN